MISSGNIDFIPALRDLGEWQECEEANNYHLGKSHRYILP